MAKHCIRINAQNKIIKSYSTDFEKYTDGDIIVEDDGERHFNLDLFDRETESFKLEWDGFKIVEVDLTAAKALKEKEYQITTKYNEMNTDVDTEMFSVFGTKSRDSAQANFETWKLMESKATLFLSLGLVAEKAIGSLALGDILNSNAKIQEYASGLIVLSETYAVWRMSRIKQFKNERAIILG